jgi:hypothetical protein
MAWKLLKATFLFEKNNKSDILSLVMEEHFFVGEMH